MAETQVGILISAVDDASDELAKVGTSAQTMADSVEQSSSRVQTASEKSSFSLKSLGTSMSGLMTSATSLVFAFDRAEKAQYTLNRATNLLEDVTRRVAKAQEDYNAAVAKYGADGPQAIAAATSLKAAQDDQALASERLQLAQSNMNQTMISTALMVIPTVITGITSLQGVIGGMSVFLATNPMGWLIIALAAVAVLIVALVTNFGGFRDAVIGVFTAIYSAVKPVIDAIIGIIQGLYNIINGIVDAVAGFINWLTGAASTAATTAKGITTGAGPGAAGGGVTAAGTMGRGIRYYQFGGIVEETGLAFLHRGEAVIPAGGSSSLFNDYSTINIYATIGSDYDVSRLADRLDEERRKRLMAYGRRSVIG